MAVANRQHYDPTSTPTLLWPPLRRLAAALSGVLFGAAATAAPPVAADRVFADAGCNLSDGVTERVEAIIDGTTVRLAGGTEVSLAGLDTGTAVNARAVAALEALSLGRQAVVRHGAIDRDRYGRLVGHVFVEGSRQSLQAELLARGLGVVSGLAEDRACLGGLLAAEDGARLNGVGIWANLRPLNAYGAEILEIDGAFALVEGRVLSIGRRERTVYLNFGRHWTTDFTVSMSAADANTIEAEGGTFDALIGQRVRIRGWLTQRDGPWIVVDHAEQIELLDDGS